MVLRVGGCGPTSDWVPSLTNWPGALTGTGPGSELTASSRRSDNGHESGARIGPSNSPPNRPERQTPLRRVRGRGWERATGHCSCDSAPRKGWAASRQAPKRRREHDCGPKGPGTTVQVCPHIQQLLTAGAGGVRQLLGKADGGSGKAEFGSGLGCMHLSAGSRAVAEGHLVTAGRSFGGSRYWPGEYPRPVPPRRPS